MTEMTRALIVREPGKIGLKSVQVPTAKSNEATVEVKAISLNRGEVKRALTLSEAGARPGWDISGIVTEAAIDGSGPRVGSRVVGVLPAGAWAEFVRVPTSQLAVLPEKVSFAQAATLPVAGLTALLALRKGGLLLGHKVLVDGASGGVGHYAVQIAAAAGAIVYAHVRTEKHVAMLEPYCNGGVIVAPTLEGARASGPYHLVVDSIGGSALGSALSMLTSSGVCVTFGISESETCTFNSAEFFRATGTSLQGIMMFDEIRRSESASESLAILLRLLELGRLKPQIEIETSWRQAQQIAEQLIARAYTGKAVLHVD